MTTARSERGGLALLVVGLAAGCLPEAGPGIGGRVVEGRGIADVAFAQGAAGPSGDLVFTRRGPVTEDEAAAGEARDLFALPTGGAPRLLAGGIQRRGWRERTMWDARGRVLVPHHVGRAPDNAPIADLGLMDLASGAEQRLGLVRFYRLSPDGQVLLLERPDGAVLVRGLDDRERPVSMSMKDGRFHGSDLYYVDPEGLQRLRTTDPAPVQLVVGAWSWRPIPGRDPAEAMIVIERFADRDQAVSLLRNAGAIGKPITGPPTALSPWRMQIARGDFIGAPGIAPTGDRIALIERREPGRVRTRVIRFEQRGLPEETAELLLSGPGAPPPPPPGPEFGGLARTEITFRPQSGEVWYVIDQRLRGVQLGTAMRAITRWRKLPARIPDQGPADEVLSVVPPSAPFMRGSFFTASGQHWLYLDRDFHVYLAPADDPDGETRVDLSEFNLIDDRSFRELDGRLLVRTAPSVERQDLAVVDLAAPELRVLGRNLGPYIPGKDRIVAIVDRLSSTWSPGTLMSYDLARGSAERLAQNVTEFVLPPCTDCDRTAPGQSLFYVVHARVPYAYDGLWGAVLP